MMDRYIIVKRGCIHCRRALSVINRLNLKLPFDKRIKIRDNYEWEEFRMKSLPITQKFSDSDFEGYPLIFLDGVIYSPSGRDILRAILEGHLKEDFILK